jgi:hypothetical protein
LAEEAAERGQTFETRQPANGCDGFFCLCEKLAGGGEPDVDDVLVGSGAKAIAEHAKEVLAIELCGFGHLVQWGGRGVIGVYPFPGLGEAFEQFDPCGAPGNGQFCCGGFGGQGLADKVQQDIPDHGIGPQVAEGAATADDASEPGEAFAESGGHRMRAFQPAKIGMLFGQRFIDDIRPEE